MHDEILVPPGLHEVFVNKRGRLLFDQLAGGLLTRVPAKPPFCCSFTSLGNDIQSSSCVRHLTCGLGSSSSKVLGSITWWKINQSAGNQLYFSMTSLQLHEVKQYFLHLPHVSQEITKITNI